MLGIKNIVIGLNMINYLLVYYFFHHNACETNGPIV